MSDAAVKIHQGTPRGAGGGKGGGGGGIKEKDNSARSRARARFIDAISEGECGGPFGGPENWLKNYYLDGVPVENQDGTRNFDCSLAYRVGTQSQSPYPGFDGVENEISEPALVSYGTPVTKRIINDNVDACRVRLRFTAGMADSSRGDRIRGSKVNVLIEWQSNNGGFVPAFDTRVYEKTSANYERDYYIPLSGGAPYDIRVTRKSRDSDSQLTTDAFNFQALTEIVEDKLRYPLTATVAGEFSADQFGRIPTRTGLWKGIVCSVPRNYDPDARTYSTSGPGTTNGIWDGTFKRASTDCPAWLLREVGVATRWGMGKYLKASQINKWALYAIAQYCDEMVDDGRGGLEPRWTFFAYLQKQQDAWQVLDMLSQAFRGMTFWGSGEIVAVADRPKEPVHVYTNANVVGGRFKREGSALDTRFTRVIAYYNDDAELGARVPVVVDDEARIAKYGIIVKEIDAYTRSPGMAQRVARSVLATNAMETDVLSFGIGAAGTYRNPGDIVEIYDNARAKMRRASRLDSSTLNSVTLDAPVTLTDGVEYTLTLQMGERRILRQITNGAGTHRTLTVDTPFESVPGGRDVVWLVNSDEIAAELFRILGVRETEPQVYETVAMTYAAKKYPYIDLAQPLPAKATNSLLQRPSAPTGLQALERLYRAGDGNVRLIQAMFSWDFDQRVTQYAVTLSSDDEPPVTQMISGPSLTWLNIAPGKYTLTVVAMIGALRSAPTARDFVLDGDPDPQVDFTVSSRTIEAQRPLQFTDISNQAPNEWLWEFGDGETSNAQNPEHAYDQAGTYSVALTAGNGGGTGTLTKTDYITVADIPPIADFAATTDGLEATFTDTSTGGSITSYAWDFGDGETSTEANPTHTYTVAGTYDVELTVTGPEGSDTTTRQITVTD